MQSIASYDDSPLLASPEPAALLQKGTSEYVTEGAASNIALDNVRDVDGEPPSTPPQRSRGRGEDASQPGYDLSDQTPQLTKAAFSDTPEHVWVCVPAWQASPEPTQATDLLATDGHFGLGAHACPRTLVASIDSPEDYGSSWQAHGSVPNATATFGESSQRRGSGSGLATFDDEEEISRFLVSLFQQSPDVMTYEVRDGAYVTSSNPPVPMVPRLATDPGGWCSQLPLPWEALRSNSARTFSSTAPSRDLFSAEDGAWQISLSNAMLARHSHSSLEGLPTGASSTRLQRAQSCERPCVWDGTALAQPGAEDTSMKLEQPPYLSEELHLQPCSYCGRRFRSERLAVHEDVCQRSSEQRRHRPVFESRSQRCSHVGHWWSKDDVSRGSSSSFSSVASLARSRISDVTNVATRSRRAASAPKTPTVGTRSPPNTKGGPKVVIHRGMSSSTSTRSSSATVPKRDHVNVRAIDPVTPESSAASTAKVGASGSPVTKQPMGVAKVSLAARTRALSTPSKMKTPSAEHARESPATPSSSTRGGREPRAQGKRVGASPALRSKSANNRKVISANSRPAENGKIPTGMVVSAHRITESGRVPGTAGGKNTSDLDYCVVQEASGSEPVDKSTPPPRSMAPPVFTPPALTGQSRTEPPINHQERNGIKDDGLQQEIMDCAWTLNELSDVHMLPDLQRRGPATATVRGRSADNPRRTGDAQASSHQDLFWNALASDIPALDRETLCSSGKSVASQFPHDMWVPLCHSDVQQALNVSTRRASSSEGLRRETVTLPVPPTLPLFEATKENSYPHSGHVANLVDSEEEQHAERCLLNANEFHSHSQRQADARHWRDASPQRFSDPEVLTAMMADVKLLGAHVDRLISSQQRLFSAGSCVEHGSMAIGSDATIRRVSADPSPTDSLDAWVPTEATWPSQPYDPSKYGSSFEATAGIDRNTDSVGNGSGSCHGWHVERWNLANEDTELHSMVDSLERQSSLFQARIRECSKQIFERRRQGQGERGKGFG